MYYASSDKQHIWEVPQLHRQMQMQHKQMQMHIQKRHIHSGQMHIQKRHIHSEQMQMQIHRAAYLSNVTKCQADEEKVMQAWAKIARSLLSLHTPC